MPLKYKIDVMEELKNRGLTRRALRDSGVLSESVMSALMNHTPITWSTLERLCGILECNVEDIITFDPNIDKDSPADFDGNNRYKKTKHWILTSPDKKKYRTTNLMDFIQHNGEKFGIDSTDPKECHKIYNNMMVFVYMRKKTKRNSCCGGWMIEADNSEAEEE